jgi:uncharacterized membrane protein
MRALAAPMPEATPEPPWSTRGRDLSRLLALTDGIFAFAMTLLVLGLVLPIGFNPSSVDRVLWNLRAAFLAYLLSFFVIWLYWRAHHLIFRYIRSYDRTLLNLNVLFLLFIAVVPFVTNLLSAAGSERTAAWAYSVVQVSAGGALTALWKYSVGQHRHVDPDFPRAWERYLTFTTLLTPMVFLISIPIALVNTGVAEYAWFALFVAFNLTRRLWIPKNGP